jgi:hypothetical protein
MYTDFTGRYHVHESSRSFHDVVAALEAAVGSVENDAFQHEVSEARDASDFEERMHRHEGTSGFMRFHTIDHGAWLGDFDTQIKSRLWKEVRPGTQKD